MTEAVWLLGLVPFAALGGFFILGGLPIPLGQRLSVFVGIGAVLLSFALALAAAVAGGAAVAAGESRTLTSFPFLNVGGMDSVLRIQLDAVSLFMALAVTGIGSMVALYAPAYLAHKGLSTMRRFFALMDLFLAAMLIIVLADDLVMLFLGWELVGLCSFFLIGFDTLSAKASDAGRKAFIVTRIADAMLILGFFMLFQAFGTLNISLLLERAAEAGPADRYGTIALILVLLGALGKSAQVPLHTWLPDAMAGPTPVSALLHAATMVAAGAFLLARLAPLFALSELVSDLVTGLALITVLTAGLAALFQADIKRLLAYSTVSQLGFMFLAIGLGAWGAALVHFLIHGAFKALLFLSAGTLEVDAGDERRLWGLQGARARSPLAYWTFAIGAASLAGMPWLTAGFYSKESILAAAWIEGSPAVWLLAFLGSVLTATYALRPVWILAQAPDPTARQPAPDRASATALLVLAVAAVALGPVAPALHRFLTGQGAPHVALGLSLIGAVAPLIGLGLAWGLSRARPDRLTGSAPLARFIRHGFGLDSLYRRAVAGGFETTVRAIAGDPMIVGPPKLVQAGSRRTEGRLGPDPLGRLFAWIWDRLMFALSSLWRFDPAQDPFRLVTRLTGLGSGWLPRTETGDIRDYGTAIALGAVLLLLWLAGDLWL